MPSDQFVCTHCPLCITNRGHTQPAAFMKLSTVDDAPLSSLTVVCKGSFTFPRYTYIVDVEASESEGENGEESEKQDLCDQFNDIYDDPDKNAKSGGVDIEEQMDALATSSSDSPVQPVRCSKCAATHCIQSSSNLTSESSSMSSSCCRPLSKDTLTSDSSLSSWKSPESIKVTAMKSADVPPDAPQDNNAKKVVYNFTWI